MTYVTLQFAHKDLQLKTKDDVQEAEVHMFGEFKTITGRIIAPFEETLKVPGGPRQYQGDWVAGSSIGQKAIPLPPGTYRLDVVVKDVVGGNINNEEKLITVPKLDADRLFEQHSGVGGQDREGTDAEIGTGQFVIGSSFVRPRLGTSSSKAETLGIYMKLYNFGADEVTHKPVGEVHYEVFRAGTSEPLISTTDDVGQIKDASASQVTIEKKLRLEQFAPGRYTIRLRGDRQKP